MAYCTRADIEAIYGANHVLTLLAADVDANVAIAAAIENAQSRIDPYLRQRYQLPLAVVPNAIKSAAIDIACWLLAPAADRNSEQIEKRAKMHLDFLRDLAKGNASLDELEAASIGGASPGVSATSDGGAEFTAAGRRFERGGGLL